MTGGNAALDLTAMPAGGVHRPAGRHRRLVPRRRPRGRHRNRQPPVLTLNNAARTGQLRDAGFIKLVIEGGSRRLIGVQAVAPEAGELIQAAVPAIRHRMTKH